MNTTFDKLSHVAKLATDVLFVKNPVGTSMGALAGAILDGVISVAAPHFAAAKAIKAAGVSIFHWIAVGIFGFNLRTWFTRDEIDPKIKNALDFIEEQVQQGRLTRTQAKLKYYELVVQVVENVRLDPATAIKLDKLTD